GDGLRHTQCHFEGAADEGKAGPQDTHRLLGGLLADLADVGDALDQEAGITQLRPNFLGRLAWELLLAFKAQHDVTFLPAPPVGRGDEMAELFYEVCVRRTGSWPRPLERVPLERLDDLLRVSLDDRRPTRPRVVAGSGRAP